MCVEIFDDFCDTDEELKNHHHTKEHYDGLRRKLTDALNSEIHAKSKDLMTSLQAHAQMRSVHNSLMEKLPHTEMCLAK